MVQENISQEFRLKKKYETKNYLIEEINRNDLKSQRNKKICTVLNYIEHSLISVSAITGCVSIVVFCSFVGFPVGIGSSPVGLNFSAITAVIKTYKSIIKKDKKSLIKVPLAKAKLMSLEVLISKDLTDSYMMNLFL